MTSASQYIVGLKDRVYIDVESVIERSEQVIASYARIKVRRLTIISLHCRLVMGSLLLSVPFDAL